MQRKLLGTISVEFDITGQQLIIYSASSNTGEKMEYSEGVHQHL